MALQLYYITDRRQFAGDAQEQEQRLLAKIAECAAAGVEYIQLREKDLEVRALENLAHKAMAAIGGSRTQLIINGRTDVALACGAHGVHLPANDLSASEVRSIFARAGRSEPVIGVSTHSAAEVASAESHGASFAVFGPVFEKGGSANAAGLEHCGRSAIAQNQRSRRCRCGRWAESRWKMRGSVRRQERRESRRSGCFNRMMYLQS